MNSKNIKTADSHKLLLNLTNKTNFKRSDKYVALSSVTIYYSWKNIRKYYNNNKFKISVPTWNEEFELTDGWHSVTDIQEWFKYIIKNMRQLWWSFNKNTRK